MYTYWDATLLSHWMYEKIVKGVYCYSPFNGVSVAGVQRESSTFFFVEKGMLALTRTPVGASTFIHERIHSKPRRIILVCLLSAIRIP